MTWTALTFGYESILTSAKMTQMYNNLTAFVQGHTGAPQVTSGALTANVMTGSKLSMNQESYGSQSIPATSRYTPTTTGILVLNSDGTGSQLEYEAYINSTWWLLAVSPLYFVPVIYNTGSNWRVYNSSIISATLYWVKI